MSIINPWAREYLDDKFKEEDPWKYLTSPYEQTKYKRQLDVIRDREPNARKVLEIGPAEGIMTVMLAEQFPHCRITAVEVSAQAHKRAKERIEPYKDQIELVNADIIEYEPEIENGNYDVCIWSESVYYIGARLALNDTYELLRKMIGKLKPGGLLLMANAVDLPDDVPESAITKRPLIDCYYHFLSSLASPALKAVYVEEKQSRIFEYQIWSFIA